MKRPITLAASAWTNYAEMHAHYVRVRQTLIEVIRDPSARNADIDHWLGELRRAEDKLNAAFVAAVK